MAVVQCHGIRRQSEPIVFPSPAIAGAPKALLKRATRSSAAARGHSFRQSIGRSRNSLFRDRDVFVAPPGAMALTRVTLRNSLKIGERTRNIHHVQPPQPCKVLPPRSDGRVPVAWLHNSCRRGSAFWVSRRERTCVNGARHRMISRMPKNI